MSGLNSRLIKVTTLSLVTALASIPMTSFAESAIVNEIAQQNAASPSSQTAPSIPVQASATGKQVTANLTGAHWKGDLLDLSFNLTTTDTQPIKAVTVKGEFLDQNGQVLATKNIPVLRSTKAVADEYLTPDQPQMRHVLVKGIDKAQWNQQINIAIEQVEENY
ncbi:MAG: DUF3157 family protein [Vibrio sp.]